MATFSENGSRRRRFFRAIRSGERCMTLRVCTLHGDGDSVACCSSRVGLARGVSNLRPYVVARWLLISALPRNVHSVWAHNVICASSRVMGESMAFPRRNGCLRLKSLGNLNPVFSRPLRLLFSSSLSYLLSIQGPGAMPIVSGVVRRIFLGSLGKRTTSFIWDEFVTNFRENASL